MNVVILSGNICKDPELHTTQGGVNRASFTIAVNRQYTNSQGQREADFIHCVAWRDKADFVMKWLKKGKKVGIEGALQTRSYETQDGQKRTVDEVVVDTIEFLTSPEKQAQSGAQMTPEQAFGEKLEYTEEPDQDCPF